MKIGSRLALGFSLVLGCMVAIIVAGITGIKSVNAELEAMVKVGNVRLEVANNMIDGTREVSINLRNALMGKVEFAEMKKRILGKRKRYDLNFKTFEELVGKDETKTFDLISIIRILASESRELNDQVFELVTARQNNEALDLMLKKASPKVEQWISEIDRLIVSEEERTLQCYSHAEKRYARSRKIILILGALALALSVVIVLLLARSITGPLKLTVLAANRIASGDLTDDLSATEKRGDELGVLIQAFSNMVDVLREAANQADTISRGDYSTVFAPRSDKDILGISLQRMTMALRENRDLLQRQDWLKTGIGRLNEVMSGDPDLTSLAHKTITELSTYLDAQVGAIYVAQDGSNTALTLAGSYAYTRRKDQPIVFRPGEGLVGQAALEKKPILIRNVPEDYIKVTSGLGECIPRFICISPFINEGRVKGVVEVGTMSEMTDQQMKYLERAMGPTALAVESAQARATQGRLLEESRRLSEELQVQQEELKTLNEELVEQTHSLKASEEKLKVQQEELQVTNEELEENNGLLDRQKREAEKARRDIEEQAGELALASKYKSEFLANMSHELRTPLNSLLLLAQSLVENKEGNLTGDQIEAAKVIHDSGGDLLNLINDILDLSKIEAGRMDIKPGKVWVRDLADHVRASFGHMTLEKSLELKVTVREDAPTEVTSDQKRVEQIIKNLMSNAIKFTESGTVTVTFARPSQGADFPETSLSAGQCLAIEVRDTGIGIAAGNLKIIFEAFHQVDGGTARSYAGTGLGLSISRQLARLLGGAIRVESDLGKGSTFTLYLPIEIRTAASKSTEGKKPPIPQPESSIANPKSQIPDDRNNLEKSDRVILVIEDDPTFAQILLKKCHDKGFKCLATPSGETGLELAAAHLPCAVILDIYLPGIDGWAVLTALKENTQTRHIPVHIVSAEENSTEALRRGAVGQATKPLAQEDLEKTFRSLEHLSSGKPRRVLLVEDDAQIRAETAWMIGGGDVRVDEAENGEQALNALRSGGYDCLVLDLGLPDMRGDELLGKLVQEGVKLPPVVVHTARELTRKEEANIREHADSIVIKDVRSQERLLDEVSLFLHRVVSQMPEKQGKIIRDLHNTDELLRNKKVLIVDDDMRTTFALSRFLSEHGMTPLKAENGKRALLQLEENPDMDLVLMDIMMPVLDGYETMKRIRAQERFRKLPIITLTAKAMPEDREKCLEAGANDYLPKPVDLQRLVSLMRVWLCR
jgi:CheY-like chemotaxis protein/signal transduction histidine kinase/methyl-accepting chemotaxis protein